MFPQGNEWFFAYPGILLALLVWFYELRVAKEMRDGDKPWITFFKYTNEVRNEIRSRVKFGDKFAIAARVFYWVSNALFIVFFVAYFAKDLSR
jgi:hypothetical protein